MAGRGTGPDFVEALARGLDVIACFDATHRRLSLAEVATATDLTRPTARRLLLTLEELGPAADDAVAVITGTVLLSVVVHGISAGPLAARYGRSAATGERVVIHRG